MSKKPKKIEETEVEIMEDETTPVPAKEETKESEKAPSGEGTKETPKTLTSAVEILTDPKISELYSIIQVKMRDAGRLAPEQILSGIVASMFRISGHKIDGLSTDIEALNKAYPKIIGIIRDPSRNPRSIVVGFASTFDIVAKK